MISAVQTNKELVRGIGGALAIAGVVQSVQKLLEAKAYADAGDQEARQKAQFIGRVSLGMIALGALAWGIGQRMKG